MKKTFAKSLSGRIIVVNNNEDKCNPETDADNLNNIYAYGILGVLKPININDGFFNDGKDENFLKQINLIKKEPLVSKPKTIPNLQSNSPVFDPIVSVVPKKLDTQINNKPLVPLSEFENKRFNPVTTFQHKQFNRIPTFVVKSPEIKIDSSSTPSKSLFNFLPDVEDSNEKEVLPMVNLNDKSKPHKTFRLNVDKSKSDFNYDKNEKDKKHKKEKENFFSDYENINKKSHKEEDEEDDDDNDKYNNEEKDKEDIFKSVMRKKKNKKQRKHNHDLSPPILTQIKNKKYGRVNTISKLDNTFKLNKLNEENPLDLETNDFYNQNFKEIEDNKKFANKNKKIDFNNPFENFIETKMKTNKTSLHHQNKKLKHHENNDFQTNLKKRKHFLDPFDLIKFRESDILDEISNLKNITFKKNTSSSLTYNNHTLPYNYDTINIIIKPLLNNSNIKFANKTVKSISKITSIINTSSNNKSISMLNQTIPHHEGSESYKKMFENLKNQQFFQDKMNMKDNTKLFLTNLKSNIIKMDHIINKN